MKSLQQSQAPMEVHTRGPEKRQFTEEFRERIEQICKDEQPRGLLPILFQREVLLRRQPDPALVRWANTLEVTGDMPPNDLMYARYLVRKWLASLPPLYAQLASVQRIHIGDSEEIESSATLMKISLSAFYHPDTLYRKCLEQFVQTIPFFHEEGAFLRESTFLAEGGACVYSFQDWWRSLGSYWKPDERNDCMLKAIAQRLAELLEHSERNDLEVSKTGALIDLFSRSVVHSYVG